jgi:DNA polymerase-3 subunit delta'
VWQIVGQSRAVSLLQRSLEQGAVSHAYLLVGPPHVGKMTLALDLARLVNCQGDEPPCGSCDACRKISSGNHADVQVIGLDSIGSSNDKPRIEIGIDQVREIQHSSNLPPFEGRHKVFIIDGAELMSTEAANCLLKTLEEPSAGVLFILLAANESVLPDTVVSRCQRLELRPLAISQVGVALGERWNVEPQKAELLARLSHGCLGWAISAAGDDSLLEQRRQRLDRLLDITSADYEERFDYASQLVALFSQGRSLVQEILDLWLDWWRDLLLVKLGCGDAITNVDRKDALVELAQGYSLAEIRAFISSIQAAAEQLRQNANPRLVLEVLMLSIPERRAAVNYG